MSGIYFHIPFCKAKCSYCDFYKTTNNSKINELIKTIQIELRLRNNYLSNKKIDTIYFGGGTPSLLRPEQINELLNACKNEFQVDDKAEITMEANPDDLNYEYLKEIKTIGVNRLSIGIQSFSQDDLQLMKRRHNSIQAINAVEQAKSAGFKNISVDLIFGIPNMSFEQWKKNLQKIVDLNVQHLSAYHLTYHKNTKLFNDLQKGLFHEIDENDSVIQFNELVKVARENGFKHYEISNFAKEGLFSKHNSSYWKQNEYLGLGPSAHSYNKNSRQWNVSNLSHYLQALKHEVIPFEIEYLTEKERFNDYIITSIRTMWGIDLEEVSNKFGELYLKHVLKIGRKYASLNYVNLTDNRIKLELSGMLISDSIMAEFILI